MDKMESKHPKISIIVPVYNVEKYLPRCIDSILAQTFTDFELLLIDDGSKDRSGEICDEYARKDNRIRIFHKENGGVASARQMGNDKAEGKYSIHIDGDDWAEPQMLENMYSKIIETNADIVIADFFYDKNGKSIYIQQRTKTNVPSEILKDILIGKLYGALYNKLIRHSLYKERNICFIPKIDHGEDILFISQLLLLNIKVSFIHEAFYHYDQQNLNSITRNYTKKNFCIQQRYVEALIKLLPAEYDTIIEIVAFQVKNEAFYYGVLNKSEFYNYMPTSLHVILSYTYGRMRKTCMILSYFGFFSLAKRIWCFYKKYYIK